MKVRLYIKSELKVSALIEVPESKLNYVSNVLKLKTGFKVFVFNETDGEFEASIMVQKKLIFVKILRLVRAFEGLSEAKINLVFANIKNNLASDVLNSCTQIGISEFFPTITSHTTNHHFSLPRAERIVEEAVEQCERLLVPKVHSIKKFEDIVNSITENHTIIFCDEKAEFRGIQALNELKNQLNKSIFIFIGPEGGFSEEERAILQSKNAKTLSLGRFILRAETASICTAFLINLLS